MGTTNPPSFTSDHGMTPVGNYGDGRQCLLVGPLLDSESSSHNAYSQQFELSHLLRRDVEQADVE